MSKPKPITDRADRPILRTSAGLRDALFEECEAVARVLNGAMRVGGGET